MGYGRKIVHHRMDSNRRKQTDRYNSLKHMSYDENEDKDRVSRASSTQEATAKQSRFQGEESK